MGIAPVSHSLLQQLAPVPLTSCRYSTGTRSGTNPA
jgi:hypothetical protein